MFGTDYKGIKNQDTDLASLIHREVPTRIFSRMVQLAFTVNPVSKE